MAVQPRSEQTLIKKRMEVAFLGFLGLTGVLALRLTYLQWFQARGFVDLANRTQGRTLQVDASRGKILDRTGAEMATDVMAKSIVINPRVVKDRAATAEHIAELLGLEAKDREAMQERLERSRGFYCLLRRGVERKLAEKLAARVKTDPLLKGLWLEDNPIRVNPSGADGIQLIGRVNIDGRGVEGIELFLDRTLGGKSGSRTVRVSASGQPIPETETRVVAPVDGQNVRLTLDRDVQHFVEQELNKVAQEQLPDAATAVVMDIHNGHVLAMGNWPSYSLADKKVKPEQRRNRAVTDLFEPGSTFKILTAAAALQYGVPTTVHCGGSRTIGNRSVRCAHGAAHGTVDLRKMIEQSCNIAAGSLAERVGPERFYQFLDNFGFQAKTGIEFPGEEYGLMLAPEKWRTMRTVNIGFGQGIVVTPTQLVAAYAAIANDGLYMPPRLVMEAPKLESREPRRVMDAEKARLLRDHMESVVVSGTGKKAKIPGYTVAGKTGTAQIAKNGRYGHGYVASFVGFLPVKKPRLAILVSVWHPRRGQYGGAVSAPVFREIARQSVAYLGIPPDAPEDLRDGADPGTFRRYASSGSHSPND